MSCFNCRFYTGENFLACGVDPITASSSPEEGCRDWQPDPNPWGFWEVLVNPPHVDDVQIGWVPIDGWQQLACPINDLIYEDEDFRLEVLEVRLNTIPQPYIGEWAPAGVRVVGNSLWRDLHGNVVGYAEAWKLEDRDWYLDPDPLSGSGQMLIWFNSLV